MAEATSDERKPMTAADEARAYLGTPPITPAWFGRELVTQLLAEHDAATMRAETVERALAELRATLRPEYGLRYPSNKTGEPDEQLASASDEETARLLAAHGDTIMQRYRTGWEEVPADGQQ